MVVVYVDVSMCVRCECMCGVNIGYVYGFVRMGVGMYV